MLQDDDDDDDDGIVLSPIQRASIEKRTLAIADQYIHDDTLSLTNAMDFYTLANLVRNLDYLETKTDIHVLSLYRMDLDLNFSYEINHIVHGFKEVILNDCEGTHLDTIVKTVLKETKIKRFHVFSRQILDPLVDAAFEMGLKTSKLVDLSLTIEMPRETAEHICRGINHSRLKQLTLDQCEIYVDAVEILCHCFRANQSLEVLKVEHCRLRDYEVADLVRSIKDHPTLLELSVRMNRMRDEAIGAAAELLNGTPRLERLDLAQQNPGHLDIRQLAEALHTNRTLTHLNLRENYLEDSHMPILVDALSVNTTLREVNLEDCELTDDGLSHFVNSLGKFPGLTHLKLRENEFRQPLNQDALLESLHRNHVLQAIEMDDDDLLAPKLTFLMFLNKAGRRYLAQEWVSLSFWPTLLARVNRLFELPEKDYDFKEADIIFQLLQGPALLQR